MKMNKLKSLLSLAVVGTLLFTSCADLAVENVNDPTTEAVEGSAENQLKLLTGGYYDLTTALVSSYATHPDLISDQITSTNNVRNFWDFAEEPRISTPNTPTYAGATAYAIFYGGFNSAVATSNFFIDLIVNQETVIRNINEEDVTDNILAQAYFLRGLARGYLGMMYDQAFLLDENFVEGEDTPEFVDYTQMIDASISDIDEAITIAEGAGASFIFNVMPNPEDTWTLDEFVDIANSYAAKILAGEARTAAEAANTDWGQVLTYAQNGLGGPDANSSLGVFKNANIGSAGEFANYYKDWSQTVVACDGGLATCSAYLPVDVKVIHTLDTSYPTTYPTSEANGGSADLAAANSPDPRLGYYLYTTNAGFLNSSRNGNLYSNYINVRLFGGNNWWTSTNDVVFMTDTEVQLLEAEAQVWLNQTALAAPVLNNSAAGSGETSLGDFTLPAVGVYIADGTLSGGWNFTGTESLAEMQFALMREYAVEVSNLGAVGTNWFFMRRHDLLQEGSMTMFPVPAGELEILGLDLYTFGGVGSAGDEGTATGANSWTDLANQAGLKVMSKERVYTPLLEDHSGLDARDFPSNLSRKGMGNN